MNGNRTAHNSRRTTDDRRLRRRTITGQETPQKETISAAKDTQKNIILSHLVQLIFLSYFFVLPTYCSRIGIAVIVPDYLKRVNELKSNMISFEIFDKYLICYTSFYRIDTGA
jgi:hypothetical protein